MQAGELLYCKKRSETKCCFNNNTCVSSWASINSNIDTPAILFLNDTVSILVFFYNIVIRESVANSTRGLPATYRKRLATVTSQNVSGQRFVLLLRFIFDLFLRYSA
jgi:hypothetical protein